MGARSEKYQADEIIMKPGNPQNNKMYVVTEGEVILYCNYRRPDEYLVGICGKGKTFGEVNLFNPDSSVLTAVAYTDCQVVWFEKYNLESFLNGYPAYAMHLIQKVSKSFLLLGKNLGWAINEINSLREQLSALNNEEEPEKLDLGVLREELAKKVNEDDALQ